MIDFEQELANKKALIFTMDEMMFPKKDYLLQVYYLFAEFMAYIEQKDSKAMLNFMQQEYLKSGEDNIFNKLKQKFDIPEKYLHNFETLHQTARLPLKILLYQSILDILKYAVVERKQIYIIAEGNPDIAINKLKQTEWHGLEEYLKMYFCEEHNSSFDLTINEILTQNDLKEEECCLFANSTYQISLHFPEIKIFH